MGQRRTDRQTDRRMDGGSYSRTGKHRSGWMDGRMDGKGRGYWNAGAAAGALVVVVELPEEIDIFVRLPSRSVHFGGGRRSLARAYVHHQRRERRRQSAYGVVMTTPGSNYALKLST